jgi:hypothetical protein
MVTQDQGDMQAVALGMHGAVMRGGEKRQELSKYLTPNATIVGFSPSSLLVNMVVSGTWKVNTATDPDTSPYNR